MSHIVDGSVPDEIFPSFVKESNNVQQEVNDLIEIVKLEREKFHSQKILCELISACVKSDSLNENLKTKVEDVISETKVKPCLELENPNKADAPFSILGLSALSPPALNHEERYQLKGAVQQALAQKYTNLISELAKTTGQYCDSLVSQMSIPRNLSPCPEDKVLYEHKLDLNKQQNIYYTNLLEYYKILEDFVALRVQSLPERCHAKIEEYQLRSKMYELRVKMLHEKLRAEIFSETESAIVSYKEFLREIKEQQEKCKDDIRRLEELKEKYKQASCKQFDEILKSYKQYVASLEKMKRVHQQLNLECI